MFGSVVLSPSNVKTYMKCPRQFQAQYVTKELPWKENGAMTRGNILHELMELSVNTGNGELVDWPTRATPHADCDKCKSLYEAEAATARAKRRTAKPTPCSSCESAQVHAQNFLNTIQSLRLAGWHVRAELQAATDGMGKSHDWWTRPPKNYMRSKIDICATHEHQTFSIVIDWKSGKPWDDATQLHMNAMCLYPITKVTDYTMMFAYLDTGFVKPYTVNVDIKYPKMFDSVAHATSIMAPTLLAIEKMKNSFANDTWPATENKFCGWCDLLTCSYNKKG